MAYRVDFTERAVPNLRRIYRLINAADSAQAHAWFNGLEQTILSLNEHPARGASTPEDTNLRHLFYGRRRNIDRIIYAIDDNTRIVTIIHIRHAARDPFTPHTSPSSHR